jgi:alpha-beta hydrolase superfamily lysophospholipase
MPYKLQNLCRPAFSVAALLLGCAPVCAQQKTVHFSTADGCRIEAFYLAPSSGAYVFINTHGLGSSRGEWGPLQDGLKKRGLGYLSLDLRGHGGSVVCGGKKADYRKFTLENWASASRDIEAAAGFIRKKGVPADRLVFCGASVGANLTLKAAAEGGIKPAAVILLSPGLEYAGVRSGDYILSLGNARLLIAASQNDQYAWQSSALLIKALGDSGKQADFIDGGGGHGVNMFKTPSVIPFILSWTSGK